MKKVVVGFFFWFCCNEKGDDNCYRHLFIYALNPKPFTFFFLFEKKKMMAMSCHLFMWFCGFVATKKATVAWWWWWCCRKKKRRQLLSLSLMALLQKMATIITVAFFDGFAKKKVTVTMLSPSSMVVVL